MGCCLTKNKPKNPNIEQPTNPPLFEEEAVVKEVLSETPSLKSQQEKKNLKKPNNSNAKLVKSQTPISANSPICIAKPEPETNTTRVSVSVSVSAATEEVSVDSVSQLSEISAHPITETKQQIQRKHNHSNADRSPASLRRKRPTPTGDPNRGSKSPARRPPQSPGRKTDMAQMDRIPRRSNAPRRDSGDIAGTGAGRRSKSPATRADTGKAPERRVGRVPAKESEEGRRPAERRRPASESLENPLVSLECFIFL